MPAYTGYFDTLKSVAGKVFAYLASITLTGTDGKTITCTQDTSLDEAVAMSSKAPLASPSFTVGIGIDGAAAGAGGIAFPASAEAVADVNTLDDYEEGTWTGSPVCGTSGTITKTAGVNGRYTKMGNLVNITMKMAIDSVSSPVGRLTITGLPFASAGEVHTVISLLDVNAGYGDYINCAMSVSTLYIDRVLDGVRTPDAAAAIKAGTNIVVELNYAI